MFLLPKVSVIIPVYNTASYLQECLDSVLNQSFEDFEIICVNDGSTDSSLEILESYALKDDRIQIINQSNKGLGAARNIAIDRASGEYVLFLDSDDYIDQDTLLELYDLASRKSLDLLIFKLINFDNETYEESKASYFEMKFLNNLIGDKTFNWQDIKNKMFDMVVTAPGKLFKRDLIKNIEFPENIVFEDSLFFFKVIFKAKNIYFYDKHLYHRRIRSDSIMNSSFEKFSDCITIYDLIGSHLKRIGVYDEFAEQLFNRKCKDIFTRFTGVPEEYKKDFYDEIKMNFSKHKKELEKDGTLKICSERSLEIFNSALNSESYKEFELSVNVFDLKIQRDKIQLDYKMVKRSYEKKISQLMKREEEHANEIEEIKGSFIWKIKNLIKRILDYQR